MKDLTRQHAHARLDVARGVAAFLVFLAHLCSVFFLRLVGPENLLGEVLSVLSRHAVLVFFLMSGNLITHSILHNVRRNGRFDAVEYAASRVARIYPPLLGTIMICLAVWLIVRGLELPGVAKPYGLAGDLYRVRETFAFSMGEVVRVLTMRGGLLEIDGPLWSLYIEFQVYIVAMAVAAFWRGGMVARVVCGILALYCAWLLRGQVFFVLVWMLGAMTAFWTPPRRVLLPATGAALLAAVAALVLSSALYSAGMDRLDGYVLQLVCCVPYATLLFFTHTTVRYPRWLIATGNFSYSLYVAHFPLLLLGLSLGQDWIGQDMARTWMVASATAVLTLAFVIPFAAFTEQQGRFKALLLRAIQRKGALPGTA